MRLALLLAAAALCGCTPAALTAAAIAVSATGVALSGIHDCKEDGGCKAFPLPP